MELEEGNKMTEKWLTIDVHNHFYPKKTAQLARDVGGTNFAAKIKNQPAGFYDRTYDLEQRLQLMDEAGVARLQGRGSC